MKVPKVGAPELMIPESTAPVVPVPAVLYWMLLAVLVLPTVFPLIVREPTNDALLNIPIKEWEIPAALPATVIEPTLLFAILMFPVAVEADPIPTLKPPVVEMVHTTEPVPVVPPMVFPVTLIAPQVEFILIPAQTPGSVVAPLVDDQFIFAMVLPETVLAVAPTVVLTIRFKPWNLLANAPVMVQAAPPADAADPPIKLLVIE